MKQILNKLKQNWGKVFGNTGKITKITGLFLFGIAVLSSFEIFEFIWVSDGLIPWIFIITFTIQITKELKKWILKYTNKFFNKRVLFISIGLLAADIIILFNYFSSPSSGMVYQSNTSLILWDIILSLGTILVLVIFVPLVYLTTCILLGPSKSIQKTAKTPIHYSSRPAIPIFKFLGLGIASFVGLFIIALLIGWGLYTSQEFVSGIYWDKYFCGPSKIEKATQGVVRVETENGTGTGFWIDKDLVLTNNHVVLFDNNINVVAPGATYYSADVVQTDTIKDLAILRIAKTTDYEEPKILKWRKRWPSLAEDVFVLGFPKGTKDITATRGIVSSLTSDKFDSTKYIQTDAAINEGNSGGPLVDICGRILGISSSTLLDAENIGFAIDGSRIKDQLAEMITAGKEITSEEIKQGQTGGETETIIKYYLTVSRGDFEDAYDFYSKDLQSRVLFKGWKDSYKNTFAVRFKSAKRTAAGEVEVSFLAVDFPNNEDEDYITREFKGTWNLIKEGGIWKLNYSNIREVPLEEDYSE